MGRILRLLALAFVALGVIACADHALPPVVTAPAPQLVDRNFIVFFQTGSHALNASARQVLDETAPVARTGWRPQIQVAGHTDSAGSVAYNQVHLRAPGGHRRTRSTTGASPPIRS